MVAWTRVCIPKKFGRLNIKGCENWNVASIGKLLWQLATKDMLWVKWVHEKYMKTCRNIWDHCSPQDSSWYWKKLNGLKEKMVNWYRRGIYRLTNNGIYSVSSSYIDILGPLTRLTEADLIWNSIMLPSQRVIMWVPYQNKLLTKERMMRLQFPDVGDTNCCLCALATIENQHHLFVDCTWIVE